MYCLIVGIVNGETSFFGPFKTKERAIQYAEAYERDMSDQKIRISIVPLIAPHNVGG